MTVTDRFYPGDEMFDELVYQLTENLFPNFTMELVNEFRINSMVPVHYKVNGKHDVYISYDNNGNVVAIKTIRKI